MGKIETNTYKGGNDTFLNSIGDLNDQGRIKISKSLSTNPEKKVFLTKFEKDSLLRLNEETRNKIIKELKSTEGDKKENIIINELINIGEFGYLADNLEQISKLDENIAIILMKKGYDYNVLENIKKCSLSKNRFALEILKNEFPNLNILKEKQLLGLNKEVIKKLIEIGSTWFVVENLEIFSELDKKDGIILIKEGYSETIRSNIKYFLRLTEEDISTTIENIAFNDNDIEDIKIKKISDFNKNLAIKLIINNHFEYFKKNIGKFSNLDKEVAMELIKINQGESIANNIAKFSGLDKEVAIELIKIQQGDFIVDNIDQFSDFELNKETFSKLINKDQISFIIKYLNNFSNIDGEMLNILKNKRHKFENKSVFNEIVDNYIIENIKKLHNLDNDTALFFIERKKDIKMIINLKNFSNLNSQTAALIMNVNHNIDEYSTISEEIMKIYNKDDFNLYASEDSDKIRDLNKKKEFFDKGYLQKEFRIAANLKSFSGLSSEILLKLINKGYGKEISENPNSFYNLSNEVALKLIKKGYNEFIKNNLKIFKNVNEVKLLTEKEKGTSSKNKNGWMKQALNSLFFIK